MCFPKDIRVEFVAKLDAHVCELADLLGEPQVKARGEKLVTGWAFEYPQGKRHWIVSHESELPVFKDGGCTQHEMLTWQIFGETEDLETIRDLCSYLTDGGALYIDGE
ncbi:MAG: hypothetical protein KDA57_14785 [Planctomycetales bacterium]|nr:hypothetical protein [Planctomycetales bacterium]